MGRIKNKGPVTTEYFQNSKSRQEEIVRELLYHTCDKDILVFTDVSALCNQEPMREGTVIYMEGYKSVPVLHKNSVRSMSPNCTEELIGMQTAMEFLTELKHSFLKERCIHFFIDCQPAIITAFEIVTKIKEYGKDLYSIGNTINVD